MPQLQSLLVPFNIINITQLRLAHPLLQRYRQYTNEQSRSPSILVQDYTPGPLETPAIVYPQKVVLDSINTLSIAVNSSIDLVELWKQTDPGVAITELTVRVDEAVPSYMDSNYLPATGYVTRLDFLNQGIRNFDLDVLYSALNMTALADRSRDTSRNGVAMSSGAVGCTLSDLLNTVDCVCSFPRFVNAPHCPSVVPWQCPDGTVKLLLPTDICDGERDCDDGSDEASCRIVFAIDARDNSSFTQCQTSFSVLINSGVGYDPSNLCHPQHLLLRSNRSIEGQIGGETYRIFVADDGCAYVLFRLKHDNGTGWFTIGRAALVSGRLFSSDTTINCPTWTVSQFQHAYEDFHHPQQMGPVENDTTSPSRSSSGLSQDTLVLITGAAVVLAVGLLLVSLVIMSRRQLVSVNVNTTLKQLLRSAQNELDELYGQSKTQGKTIITLSK
jgi:hypothetical protein